MAKTNFIQLRDIISHHSCINNRDNLLFIGYNASNILAVHLSAGHWQPVVPCRDWTSRMSRLSGPIRIIGEVHSGQTLERSAFLATLRLEVGQQRYDDIMGKRDGNGDSDEREKARKKRKKQRKNVDLTISMKEPMTTEEIERHVLENDWPLVEASYFIILILLILYFGQDISLLLLFWKMY